MLRNMDRHGALKIGILLLVLVSSIVSPAAAAQATSPQKSPNVPSSVTRSAGPPGHYLPNRFSKRASLYYEGVWGVDSLNVKSAESGEIIRFSYRILDATKAAPLNDKKFDPFLLDEQEKIRLVVPSLEKVGQLRQSSTPAAGKSYWMAFSNPGRRIKAGDRVKVMIGKFRAEGLVVE